MFGKFAFVVLQTSFGTIFSIIKNLQKNRRI